MASKFPEEGRTLPLPGALRNGLAAVSALGITSFVSTTLLIAYITYRLARWEHVKHQAARQRCKQTDYQQHHGAVWEGVDLSLGLEEKHFHLINKAKLNTPASVPTTPKDQFSFVDGEESSARWNPVLMLIYNLLFANLMEALAFMISIVWLIEDEIKVPSGTCWAQGWFMQVSKLMSSGMLVLISVNTYVTIVRGHKLSRRTIYGFTTAVWIFAFGVPTGGVLGFKNGQEYGGYYARAGAWCWVSPAYSVTSLWLEYFWIFVSMVLTLLLLVLVVVSLQRNRQSARHLPSRISDSMEPRGKDEPPKPSGQHPAFLLYPIIYIVCTAPLAIGRMAAMAGAKPGWIFYSVAGSMIASHGWLNVGLWSTTMIFIGDQDIRETGLDRFAFLRTPNRRYGNVVSVRGGGGQANAGNTGPWWERCRNATNMITIGRPSGDYRSRTVSLESLRRGSSSQDDGRIQLEVVTTVVVEKSYPGEHWEEIGAKPQRPSPADPDTQTLFIGVSAGQPDVGSVTVSLSAHDKTYLVDFTVHRLQLNEDHSNVDEVIANHVIDTLQKYAHEHFAKFVGAGLPTHLLKLSPSLCSRLWLEVDNVPIVIPPAYDAESRRFWDLKHIDEQADSMARKCVMHFGPSMVPLLQVGWQGSVQVDAGFRAHLMTAEDHRGTVGQKTWNGMSHYAEKLKEGKVKIAFFSSTPQGGGVSLMRHALVRFSKLLGVNLTWYVPKPRPGVFRSTKNMHNILQGVAGPDERLSDDEKAAIRGWITDNAQRYWLAENGPLRPPSEGGADIVVVDDPQMPGIIPLAKQTTPDRPVLYRSHIQIRSDLVAQAGSPQADVWEFLWNDIRHADMFISHPIPQFVPQNIPREMVVYMPATTDWLDGLNKRLNEWDSDYYGNNYNLQCMAQQMTQLDFPDRAYIVQIARFDPSKGIPTVIDSYAEFRKRAVAAGLNNIPQLVIAGNSSIDDPDGNMVYDQAMDQIETRYAHLSDDISVMRLEANDQLLNVLIARAHVVLQLSTREGFEVKVSEALHAGRPVIATRAGGIPLQVKDGQNGFLVEPGDYGAVAQHLTKLFADHDLWAKMSQAARIGVSDEVSTPGNALAWYYLAARWTEVHRGEKSRRGLVGDERWVNDMAREGAGLPYDEGENRLARHLTSR